MTTVAVVRSDNRRAAVAQALALIAPDVQSRIAPEVLLKPNLVSHKYQPASTHADTFSATLDAVLAAGAERVTVAEGASDATAGFHRFGLDRMAWNRPVRFFDINKDETEWDDLELRGGRIAALGEGFAHDCRVSVPGLSGADEDARDVDGDVFDQKHVVVDTPNGPGDDARSRGRW